MKDFWFSILYCNRKKRKNLYLLQKFVIFIQSLHTDVHQHFFNITIKLQTRLIRFCESLRHIIFKTSILLVFSFFHFPLSCWIHCIPAVTFSFRLTFFYVTSLTSLEYEFCIQPCVSGKNTGNMEQESGFVLHLSLHASLSFPHFFSACSSSSSSLWLQLPLSTSTSVDVLSWLNVVWQPNPYGFWSNRAIVYTAATAQLQPAKTAAIIWQRSAYCGTDSTCLSAESTSSVTQILKK